jgi:hypothetical protein
MAETESLWTAGHQLHFTRPCNLRISKAFLITQELTKFIAMLIVGECILLGLYSIKHDNHVTSFATILSCVIIAYVFILTTFFGYSHIQESKYKVLDSPAEKCLRSAGERRLLGDMY